MKPCVCGHPAALHEHHRRGTDCGQRGCPCPQYRRPRWWRRTPDVPAAVSVQQALPPEPAPPPGPLLPPGQQWVHDVHYREAPCGCFELINHVKRKRRTWRCEAHAFAAHWEERLRQS